MKVARKHSSFCYQSINFNELVTITLTLHLEVKQIPFLHDAQFIIGILKDFIEAPLLLS